MGRHCHTMFVQSLRLRNIRSYLDVTLNFPEGTLLLSGDIGSGKTTLLLAIEFALFGARRGELSGEALLRHGKQEGFVEMAFVLDQKTYVIKRPLKRVQGEVRQLPGSFMANGERKELSPIELRSIILDLLGYPADLLSKSKDLLFRFTVYTPQEEMKRIIFEPKETRLDTLRRVFGIDKYKRIKENAFIVMKEIRERQRLLEQAFADLEKKQQQESELKQMIIEGNEKLASLSAVSNELHMQLKVAKEQLLHWEQQVNWYMKQQQER